MEKILAIETSGKFLSAACLEKNQTQSILRAEVFYNIGLKHSEKLKEICQNLMHTCGWNLTDLTHLAVSTGPGSFTGLRVGITFARTLAQILQKPLIGIPIFEILAEGLDTTKDPQCIIVDSIGQDLFMAWVQPKTTRSYLQKNPNYKIISLTDFLKFIKNKKIIIAGPGFIRYQTEINKKNRKNIIAIEDSKHIPKARYLAKLASKKINSDLNFKSDWQDVLPYYMRAPIAVERAENYKKG